MPKAATATAEESDKVEDDQQSTDPGVTDTGSTTNEENDETSEAGSGIHADSWELRSDPDDIKGLNSDTDYESIIDDEELENTVVNETTVLVPEEADNGETEAREEVTKEKTEEKDEICLSWLFPLSLT